MHRFIPDPETQSLPLDLSHTLAMKRWTRELLKLGDDTVITVNDTPCVDPGCALVETTVALLGANGDNRRWRFTRPKVAVTKLMLLQTFTANPSGT